jgi:hypothetical protein
MQAAYQLKKRGYDVLVLEVASTVGGHCNTYRSSPVPVFDASGNILYPGYVDYGVVVYQDTARANASGYGVWSLDSKKFVQDLGIPTIDLDFASNQRRGIDAGTLRVDIKNGVQIPDPVLTPEQQQAFALQIQAAFGRIYNTTLQYPWLNTGKRPDPIPSFMLEPFTSFITRYQLEILYQPLFFGLLTGGGMGSIERLTTLEALQVLAPVTLDIFQVAGAGFVPQGGCQVVYDAIFRYLGGAANVKLNANIRSVRRSRVDNRVYISGKYQSRSNGFHNGRPLGGDCDDDDDDDDDNDNRNAFMFQCRKLIVGIYPVIQNLAFLDMTDEEFFLFSQVEANYYMAMLVNATGGSLANKAFTINNFDPTRPPSFFPALPSFSTLTRNTAAGPIAAYANSDSEVPVSYDKAVKLVTDALPRIPSNLLNGFKVAEINYHLYDPHFKVAALRASPSADTRLARLQGKSNTFWVGAATRYDASSVVWNQAYELVVANFPVKA